MERLRTLFIKFDNIKINIIELLYSIYFKSSDIKDDKQINELEIKTQENGFIVAGNFTQTFATLPRIYYQHMTTLESSETSNINILKLDMPTQYIGMILDHSIQDLINILYECDKYNISHNIDNIHDLILKKFNKYFTYKLQFYDSFNYLKPYESFYDYEFIPNNQSVFRNRMFGSGKNYNKVKDDITRQQLIAMDLHDHRGDYPDQRQDKNTLTDSDKYEYPLLFYINKVFPISKLNDSNSYLNLNNLDNIIDSLESINHKSLINKIVNKYCISPETSDIVCLRKYRNYASSYAIAIAFNHQLIKEQNAAIFKNSDWKYHELKLWTLDDLVDERINNTQSCSDIFLNQLYSHDIYGINEVRIATEYPKNIHYNATFKIPTNEEACYIFHNIFTNGLLHFSESQIYEFYSDNLIIGGSAFAFCACSQPYRNGVNVSKELLKHYNNSDIDCPILAGDNIYLTTSELEKIVDEKIAILHSFYPGGWKFEKKLVERRFQITNNHDSTILELFSVPYSKQTVWKHFAKYHFGWVRGYFDGFNWYILPSGVISVCNRISIDIRYCATKHAPHELIYKYLKRGFAPIINYKEYHSLDTYISQKYKETLYMYMSITSVPRNIYWFNKIYTDIISNPHYYNNLLGEKKNIDPTIKNSGAVIIS